VTLKVVPKAGFDVKKIDQRQRRKDGTGPLMGLSKQCLESVNISKKQAEFFLVILLFHKAA
jgi:hypothetical protein